jgi:hypothetical protein
MQPDEIVSLQYDGIGGVFSGSAIPMPLGNGQQSKYILNKKF